MQYVNDFRFLDGRWKVAHRKLEQRMCQCTQWNEFETDYEARSSLDGRASFDRLWGEFGGEFYEGLSVRSFDPEEGIWTIYWMDTANSKLVEQVKGGFKDGLGEFFGTETLGGQTYRMRFLWRCDREGLAEWQQAYQDPLSGEWETNWEMRFNKASLS